MRAWIAHWRRSACLLLAIGMALTIPLTVGAAPVAPAYQGDALKAISLSLGSADVPAGAVIGSAELADLLNEAAKLAGASASFALAGADNAVRGEVAAALRDALRLAEGPEPFRDVPDGTELAADVGAVYKAKLMSGRSLVAFAPNSPMTYGEAYALAYRVFDLLQPFEVVEASIADIQKAFEQGKLTSKALVQAYLDRIERYDDQGVKLNAILTVNPNALAIAEQLDNERMAFGPRGPLHGIPIIVKDNFDTADMPTTAGCTCLKDSVPPDDAEQVARLKEAGAILIAKANLHEFAFGTTTVSSLGGQTLNPYALDRNPGGSSGGTGAAIAANFAAAGFGTDTGGSIRIPSSNNGLVGIRPTVGLSSRDGIIPLALTQDVGGPMARTVADAALLLDATAGYDPDDIATAYSVGRIPASYTDYLDADGLKGARIGLATELLGDAPEEKPVDDLILQAADDMRRLGAEVIDVRIPNLEEIMAYPSLSGYEFKFQLNDYLASLGPDAPYHSLTEILASGEILESQRESMTSRNERESLDTEEYKDIILFRTKLTREALLRVMADNDLDAIIYPSTSQTASLVTEGSKAGSNNRLSAFSGFPAITVPAGFTAEGLPAGVEFIGREFDEPTLIKLAYSYEQGTHHRKPPALTP